MERSCPGQQAHPPSRVNFSERLYERKVDPFARVNSWPGFPMTTEPAHALIVSAGRVKVFLWRKVGPARRVTRLGGSTF